MRRRSNQGLWGLECWSFFTLHCEIISHKYVFSHGPVKNDNIEWLPIQRPLLIPRPSECEGQSSHDT
jgi:hypothetical protein